MPLYRFRLILHFLDAPHSIGVLIEIKDPPATLLLSSAFLFRHLQRQTAQRHTIPITAAVASRSSTTRDRVDALAAAFGLPVELLDELELPCTATLEEGLGQGGVDE